MAESTPSSSDLVDNCSEGRASAGPEHSRRDSCDSRRCHFHPTELADDVIKKCLLFTQGMRHVLSYACKDLRLNGRLCLGRPRHSKLS
jgi:hypothetical protein